MTLLKFASEELGFNSSQVSSNALDVVKKLQKNGFDGYLVGGCVRDLILELSPKDYDVTTNARPEQVKALFPRSRIIGRRFKIVHVTYGRGWEREVIEVATYRASSPKARSEQDQITTKSRATNRRSRSITSDSGRILDDNVYGTLEEDVARRDFTVNSLYYDPINEIVLDYFQGVAHVSEKSLHIIGDISTRFVEDPVRMLRAIRFKAKLGLQTGQLLDRQIEIHADRLADVPGARLFEEVLKLFHYGAALSSWKALFNTPLAMLLFPLTCRAISAESGHRFEDLIAHALKNTDTRINNELPVMAGFLYAVLLWKPFCGELERMMQLGNRRNEACFTAAEVVFKAQNKVISVPWRVRTPATDVWDLQYRLENRIPRTIQKLLIHRRFRAAYDFLELRSRVGEVDKSLVDWWTTIQQVDPGQQQSMISALKKESGANKPGSGKNKRRWRRHRGKKNTDVDTVGES